MVLALWLVATRKEKVGIGKLTTRSAVASPRSFRSVINVSLFQIRMFPTKQIFVFSVCSFSTYLRSLVPRDMLALVISSRLR